MNTKQLVYKGSWVSQYGEVVNFTRKIVVNMNTGEAVIFTAWPKNLKLTIANRIVVEGELTKGMADRIAGLSRIPRVEVQRTGEPVNLTALLGAVLGYEHWSVQAFRKQR